MNKAIETLIKRHRFSPEDKKLLIQIAKSSSDNNGNLDNIRIKYLLDPHIIVNNDPVNTDLTDGTNFKSDYLNTGLYRVFDVENSGMVLTPYSITSSEIRCKLPEGEIIVRISNGKYIIISDFGEVE